MTSLPPAPPPNTTTTKSSPQPTATTAALFADDSDYNSSEDEDFHPSAAPAKVDPDTSDGDGDDHSENGDKDLHAALPPKKQKRKRRGSSSSTDNSDGEGGLIKTRAQRARESNEKTRLGGIVPASGTETDVDELWRQMNSKPTRPKTPTPESVAATPKAEVEGPGKVHCEETVTISRTYTFAGKSHTELKIVPRDSQEARTYLSSLSPASASITSSVPVDAPTRRPPPKKRVSIFDAAAAARKPAQPAQKMNTLEKSRLDWAGFVDKEGIGEELQKHTRGDKAYLDRQAFLSRVEEKRDQAWKEGQKKG